MDRERVYDLDYLTEILPQLLTAFDQVLLAGELVCLLRSLLEIVRKNLFFNKWTCQGDSDVPKRPVSKGETWKCSNKSYPKHLGTPFPMQ
jgi:hypothetical protein